MKRTSFVSGLLFTLFMVNGSFAQDVIYKHSGEIIKAKIKEIGTDELKYLLYDEPEGPSYTLPKAAVEKVVYEGGRTETYRDNFEAADLYARQHTRALKIGFLSPLFSNTNFSFEKNLKPGRSIEAKVGIIGMGMQKGNTTGGVFVSGAYKFIKTPDYYLPGMRYAHILKGGYVKPEAVLGMYGRKYQQYEPSRVVKENITYSALMLNFGKQWIFSDIFLVDFSAGAGYAFDSSDKYFIGNYHHNLATLGDSGLAFSANLNIGFLF